MLSQALAAFLAAGYVYIGMDHFALPGDSLAVAKRQGRLHRNFQGYSTQADCDLVALGVSSIGKVGATYSQNAKTMEEYCDLLDQGKLPVVRGLALSRDDLARRAVIMALMCQGQVVFEAIETAWLLDFRSCFAAEMEQMKALQEQGMVVVDDTGIQVTAQGWFFVRAVAMQFDKYLQALARRRDAPAALAPQQHGQVEQRPHRLQGGGGRRQPGEALHGEAGGTAGQRVPEQPPALEGPHAAHRPHARAADHAAAGRPAHGQTVRSAHQAHEEGGARKSQCHARTPCLLQGHRGTGFAGPLVSPP